MLERRRFHFKTEKCLKLSNDVSSCLMMYHGVFCCLMVCLMLSHGVSRSFMVASKCFIRQVYIMYDTSQ